MFRLKEQQLHMLIWLIVVASIVIFCILGIEPMLQIDESGSWKGMEDFSSGWVCTYETGDEEKYKEYQKGKEEVATKDEVDYTIIDVVTLPNSFLTRNQSTVSMTHRIPEMDESMLYMTLEIEDVAVKVSVGNDVIYQSRDKEKKLSVRHIIPIASKYEELVLKVELSGPESEEIEVEAVQIGNYNQLWLSTLQAEGVVLPMAFFMIVIGGILLTVRIFIKNTWQQKRTLLYAGAEGIVVGSMYLLNSEVIPLLTGWNYGVYVLRVCVLILAMLLHLMIMRCFIFKKKVLGLVDTTLLLLGVLYISVMVLQGFSLVQFDTIYIICACIYVVLVVAFTIVLIVSIFDYGRKEGMPVFVANVIYIIGMFMQLVMFLISGRTVVNDLYGCIGFVLYMLYIWIYSLRQALFVQPKCEEQPMNEEQIRTQVVEQLNPNLLFAAFHTLQMLIKNGSDKSMKMIYYISLYFRDNLKAIENAGEVISFEEELEHMIAYLQLQRTRNQNLEVAIECKAKDFNIPRHSLEPLVENAVKHGIAQNGNAGNVAIRTYIRADGYAVQIIDDGAGFDVSVLKRGKTSMAKKLAQLEELCQAKTEVISKPNKGTVITIVLPMLENELMDDLDEMFEG